MEKFTPDNFISDKAPLMHGFEVVAKSAIYQRGQIFAIKADNKLYALDLADKDGAAIPYFVLGEVVNATNGDIEATGYYIGSFNKDKLIYGSNVAANVWTACRRVGIYPVEFI